MSECVLVVDDDPIQRRLVEAQLSRMGVSPLACATGEAALDALAGPEGPRIGAVVLDLLMPGLGGLDVLLKMRQSGSEVPVVVQTAKGSIDTVIEAMRAGAFDFVVKPVSPEKLGTAISNALRMRAAAGYPQPSGREAGETAPSAGLEDPAASPAMRSLLQVAARAARSTIPLLVEGETGTGKEWLSRAIHAAGPRAGKPFVAVNCGALPAELVESILFGHVKGAFTDARETLPGKFVEADGGTLFLDEIAELPLAAQVKLLRVLQDSVVDPVGGRGAVTVDVRIVSATNRDLAERVASGAFRADLYYRLAVLSLELPPLRARRDEIPRLAELFLARHSAGGSGPHGIAPAAMELLRAYDWPGNIRQLENVVRRAVVLGEGPVLRQEDFPQIAALMDASAPAQVTAMPVPPAAPVPAEGTDLVRITGPDGEMRSLEEMEAMLIRLALLRYRGRMSEVARRLGIGRSTLYRKMQEYRIDGR